MKLVILFIVGAFVLFIMNMIQKLSFRAGLIKGLRSSASNISTAKQHKLFKKNQFWKVKEIIKDGFFEKQYAVVPVGEGNLCALPLLIDTKDVDPENRFLGNEKIKYITEGSIYRITIAKVKRSITEYEIGQERIHFKKM